MLDYQSEDRWFNPKGLGIMFIVAENAVYVAFK